jgi:Tol biopolymer transport system component/DNA-binding SARP family transcriptional activator
MSSALRIETLGRLAAETAQGTAISAPRRLALLALLAAAGSRGVSRDKVLALLWPESEPAKARHALEQLLYSLRREAANELVVSGNPLRLDSATVSSDVQRFEQALDEGDLERAVSLYRGAFLDGFFIGDAPEFERWVDTERSRLATRYADALERLALAATEARDHSRAAEWWRRRAEAEPYDSRVALELMKELTASGNPAGALLHAQAHELLLRRELDAAPSASVIAFADELRAVASGGDRAVPPRLVDRPERTDRSRAAEYASLGAAPRRTGPGRRWIAISALVGLAALAGWRLAAVRGGATPFIAGNTSRVTASPGLELDAAISPDGKLVAYAAGALGRTRIHVKHISGGPAIPIGDDALGPPHRWPRWSPDGSRIAFVAGRTIHEAPALGGRARRLFTVESHEPNPTPAWSPDGTKLAYVDGGELFVQAIEGGARRGIPGVIEALAPAWSPDGQYIAYTVGNNYVGNQDYVANTAASSIWIAPVDSGPLVRVTEGPHLNASPVWTADGRGLLYVSNAGGSRDLYLLQLGPDLRPVGKPRRLTTGLDPFLITATADGSRLAYSVLSMRANVWAVGIPPKGAASDSAARPITTENEVIEGMSVSPDGRWLAYDSNRHGNADIFKILIAGGEPVQLTRDEADDFLPVWSADGNWLAYYSLRAGTRDVYVMDANGAHVERATSEPGAEVFPTWSPDGRRIAYRSLASRDPGVYVIDRLASGGYSAPRLFARGAGFPRWSPDGRYIATEDEGTVTLYHAETAQPRVLLDERAAGRRVTFATWGPDPSVVFYQTLDAQSEHAFWSIPVTGGEPRLLLRLDDPQRSTRRHEFATDGKHVFFTISTTEADVWTLELRRP